MLPADLASTILAMLANIANNGDGRRTHRGSPISAMAAESICLSSSPIRFKRATQRFRILFSRSR